MRSVSPAWADGQPVAFTAADGTSPLYQNEKAYEAAGWQGMGAGGRVAAIGEQHDGPDSRLRWARHAGRTRRRVPAQEFQAGGVLAGMLLVGGGGEFHPARPHVHAQPTGVPSAATCSAEGFAATFWARTAAGSKTIKAMAAATGLVKQILTRVVGIKTLQTVVSGTSRLGC